MTRRLALCLWLCLAGAASAAEGPLRLLIWSYYLPPGSVELFTDETCIAVDVDTYEEGDAVEAVLLAGGSGYDLAVVSSEYYGRLIDAGALLPFDASLLASLDGLDPRVMRWLEWIYPGNRHVVPYLWGTTGIGFDRAAVAERLPGMTVDSWRVLFDPSIVSRLADCGVSMVDSVEEVTAAALLWLGHSPNGASPAAREAAQAVIAAVAPHVRQFDSGFLHRLEIGELCLVRGWSVDVLAAAADAAPGRDIGYVVPDEGATLWIDGFVMPAGAVQVEAARRFVSFMLQPELIAAAASYNWGAGAVPEAVPLMDPAVRDDPQVMPDAATLARLVFLRSVPVAQKAQMLQFWTDLKFAPVLGETGAGAE